AMGLQNATITSISGAVVRTTHITGVTTDIGTSLVDFFAWIFDRTRRRGRERWRRVIKAMRRQSDFQRLALLSSIVGSFSFGVVIGILSFNFEPAIGLAPPVAFLLFILYIDWREPIADVKEINRLADPELLQHGIAPSLLPSSIGLYRLSPPPAGLKHHAPDFASWIAEVPARVSVCVLSLSPGLQLDHEAAASLTTIAGRLRDDGRRLILAQVSAQDFEVFGEIESKEPFDPKDLCSDLEFAIARAMSVC
ncbi:MAG TPA: YoaK family protein, partial [Tepidisphaeraceae bacterium]|nr:YoaK family protein [Tepidisphaeraceae bacterium]